jgi:hypothetical protein
MLLCRGWTCVVKFLETGNKLRPHSLIFLLGLLALIPACSSPKVEAPDPATLLQNIPGGDPAKYPNLRQKKHWSNPYLIIRADGVGLVTNVAANEEKILQPEELLNSLAKLPPSAWPYGRVVAILGETNSSSPEPDKIAIRRIRGIVAGELQGAHVAIEWEPAAGS